MDYGWNEDFEEFRSDVRAFIGGIDTPALREELASGRDDVRGPLMDAVVDELEQRGWLKQCWPEELGGEGKSQWYQFVLVEEFAKAEIPYGLGTASMIGPAVHRYGTDEQREKYLPQIWNGEMTLALGYSEPNAGTDLASLETMAVRDGDEWVINGQKLWTSAAHMSTHVWLAARTDPEAPKHRGISMFIVPLDAAGVSVRPIITMSGVRTNEVFYEDVRVPSDALVGEENRGWYILANALDYERVTLGSAGQLFHTFDRLLTHVREERPELLEDDAARTRLAEVDLDLSVMKALMLTNASIVATGETPTMEASMLKVWTTELRYTMSSIGMDLLGREGALSEGSDGYEPFKGELENTYRVSPFLRFGGGTNEIQRDIVARRGLGMPR